MLIELKVLMSVLITFAQTRMVTPPFKIPPDRSLIQGDFHYLSFEWRSVPISKNRQSFFVAMNGDDGFTTKNSG